MRPKITHTLRKSMNLFISVEFSTSYVSWCSKVWPKKFDTRNKKKKGKKTSVILQRLLLGYYQGMFNEFPVEVIFI